MNNFSTPEYWEARYKSGRNSGAGSYGDEAQAKADMVNNIIEKISADLIIEIGVGDGNNLSYYNVKNYIGYDISPTAIEICRKKFNYNFSCETTDLHDADLCLCLDVLFHQVEDSLYEKTIDLLFTNNNKYVLIYSYDTDDNTGMSAHMKMRKVSKDIRKYNYKLIQNTRGFDSKIFLLYEKSTS